jgi:ribonucleoside-diphosphate reductase alpha chain
VEGCSFNRLQIIPPVISSACPSYLHNAVTKTWHDAVSAGDEWGFRNAQVTVLAPTGTIGLLMDCDTTGIEPDYSLVKYKKLVGGGYFRIVNQSVKPSLIRLGYNSRECDEILAYVNGHHTFSSAPGINKEKLIAKNFTTDEIIHLEKLSENATSLHDVFRKENFSKERWNELAGDQSAFERNDFSVLNILGFTEEEIALASLYVCGHLTVEGSILRKEHLSVFDCANRCLPYGTRFISANGHLKMMAAVQPFLSGAISKTINLPSDASRDTISECYLEGFKLGLKAVALYRDGSKLIQPLESGNRSMQHSNVLRSRLPARRKGITQRAVIGREVIYLRTGEYDDGRVGEIFIDDFKGDPDFRALLNCFAVSVSLGLQYGVPLEEFVRKFIYTQFEPGGPVDHPHIKMASSIPDFIFRLLAYEYLGRNDLVQVPGEVSGRETFENTSDTDALDHYLTGLMGDAPSCPTCGISTIRSGSCFRCINCGTTMGCS